MTTNLFAYCRSHRNSWILPGVNSTISTSSIIYLLDADVWFTSGAEWDIVQSDVLRLLPVAQFGHGAPGKLDAGIRDSVQRQEVGLAAAYTRLPCPYPPNTEPSTAGMLIA